MKTNSNRKKVLYKNVLPGLEYTKKGSKYFLVANKFDNHQYESGMKKGFVLIPKGESKAERLTLTTQEHDAKLTRMSLAIYDMAMYGNHCSISHDDAKAFAEAAVKAYEAS